MSRDLTPAYFVVLTLDDASGGTVKDGVLDFQGDQRDRIEPALTQRNLKFKRAGG